MPKIKQLSAHEAQKIAAGQVIERPANAIKELVENSLDAGASRITIYVEDGGKQLLRVVDNGCGMDKEDATRCLQKHATSKIESVDQLSTIRSYGFRGEALASISAVSTVTISTKEIGKSEGIQVVAQEGTVTTQPTACPEGTDITATNLFYNMPARAKFLKKRETETRHIIQMVQAISVAYPTHHIQLFVDNTLSINCPPQDNVVNRCAQLWGRQTGKQMIALEPQTERGVSISGAISNHNWLRYDRRTIFFLVNNRWVTNPGLGRALLKGYNNVLPQGRYPTACVAIEIDPAEIDINTHPKKEEIVFAHPRIVEQLIYKSIRMALQKDVSRQIKRDVSFAQSEQTYSAQPPFQINPFATIPHQAAPAASNIAAPPSEQAHIKFDDLTQSSQNNTPAQSNSSIALKETEPYTLIGQFHKTYLLIEQEGGLYLIDQHAAHERILYELFASRFQEIPTIKLLFPQLIACNAEDIATIEPHLNIFQDHGIIIEPFGKDQLIVQSTPVHLKNSSFNDLIAQVIGWIREYSQIDQEQFIKTMHDKLRAQMACKAAVKAGDTLTDSQMKELLEDLYTCPNRFSCPHGRPTGWLFSLHEIEKRFRRK